jgi:hypothetical protein
MQLNKTAPNLLLPLLLLMAGASSLITALLTFNGRYLKIGYQELPDGVASKGMEVWGLHLIFLVLTILIYICVMLCLAWPKIVKKPLKKGQILSILFGLILLTIPFFPYPFEFQLRNYQSPSDVTYVLLAQGSADFIDGNENSFMGSQQKVNVEEFYNNDNGTVRRFNCIVNRDWWFGKLGIQNSFYPRLDNVNHLKLLENRCQEIKNE